MKFSGVEFIRSFKDGLNETRKLSVQGKSSNGVDTRRVFLATDNACLNQSEYFQGESYWNGKEGNGEFLCDYTFRTNKDDVLLSLESEWGKASSPKGTLTEVLKDFIKIINMASPIKIMVFAYVNHANEAEIIEDMSKILNSRSINIPEQLYAISCPWDDELYSDTVKVRQWNGSEWKCI